MRSLVVLFVVVSAAVAAPQLVQPPHTPAVFLDPSGRPLDTAEVVAARDLHYQAKALEGHILKKRSIGHAVSYSIPAAVSHQSRVDVHTSPAVVEARALYAPAVYSAPTVYAAPATTYVGGSAVSHQSRVDVRSSPAVVAVEQPSVVVDARAVYAAPATVYSGGAAFSQQSRVDVHSSPALLTEQVVSPAVLEAHSVWEPTVYASTW